MSRSTDVAPGAHRADRDDTAPVDVVPGPGRRPNLSGDLDGLLVGPPEFRRRSMGYDRLQVDNYVAWVEAELESSRRETEDVLERYGRCSAELALARELLAHSPAGQEMVHLSERIGTMLQLAADEAAEITSTARAEVERLRAEAEADRTRAAEALERIGADHARLAAEAAQERARCDAEAAERRDRLDREAAARRDREAREAAELVARQDEAARVEREAASAAADAHLARVRAAVAELERREEAVRSSLARMADRLDEALAELADTLPAAGLRLEVPQQAAS
ncbi:DivIVA domain-containing protein [Geodermatophilus amargosae]|uniref:DivIVA domain-containing protein n=1 Tax=Geodermatophilus amargosae TaxID=1296565 RepID=UPI0034DDEF7E